MAKEDAGAGELAPIMVSEGVYARVNRVVVDCDLVDSEGRPVESGGFAQSPNSIITLSGAELSGTELNVQAVADRVFGR
mgnify:CR=1 FL=1